MVEKPGGWTGGWIRSPISERGNNKPKQERKINKQIGWRIGHTLSEVEELLRIERNKKTR